MMEKSLATCSRCGIGTTVEPFTYRCVICGKLRADAVPRNDAGKLWIEWHDIDYLVVADPAEWADTEIPYVVNYLVYRVAYWESWSRTGEELGFGVEKKNAIDSLDATNDLNEAAVFLDCGVKWDGCCNLAFPGQDRCRLHFCSRDQATAIGVILDRLYSLTAALREDDSELQ